MLNSEKMSHSFPESRVDLENTGLIIDGAWYPPIAYTSYLPREEYYRQIADCGIHLYCFPAYLAGRGINIHSGIGPFRKGIWQGEGVYDFSDIIADLDMILKADPEARVIMRLHLDVPEWWEREHPDGCCLRRDGSVLRQSFSSPVWQQAVKDSLRAVITWLKKSPYASNMAGIHVAAGGTEEWVYHFFNTFEDANPSRASAFSDFLKEKYSAAAARDVAWGGRNEADALSVLEQLPGNRVRDPAMDTAELDACAFHSSVLADAISGLCRVVKEESDGRLLTGAFYGYHFCIPDARKGHTALSWLLSCDDLDYLASPNIYDRAPGIDWPPMVAVDSVRLHGKLWMAENDTRTSLTRPLADTAPEICPEGQYCNGVWRGPDSLRVSAALLRANSARMLTHGYGGWWFDMWGGWFSHPDLLAELEAGQNCWRSRVSMGEDDIFDIASFRVIADSRLPDYDASFGALCGPVLMNRVALGKCGRPYEFYLRTDLDRLDFKNTRLLWLLGIPFPTAREQELLREFSAAGITVLHTDFNKTRVLSPASENREHSELGVTLSVGELRSVFKDAGVHCYLESGDVFYFGRGYMAVHATEDGEKKVCFPYPVSVQPVLGAAQYEKNKNAIVFSMRQYETYIFKISPA